MLKVIKVPNIHTDKIVHLLFQDFTILIPTWFFLKGVWNSLFFDFHHSLFFVTKRNGGEKEENSRKRETRGEERSLKGVIYVVGWYFNVRKKTHTSMFLGIFKALNVNSSSKIISIFFHLVNSLLNKTQVRY